MLKRIIIVFLIAGLAAIVWFVESGDGSNPVAAGKHTKKEARPTAPAQELKWEDKIKGRPGRESLDSLRGKLSGMSAAEAVAEIEAFLKMGGDRDTGLEFSIAAGGEIDGSPTLRVFLLDLLLEIDPEEAARISRGILENETSPDEWAVALRNVAKGEPSVGNRDYLREKTEELIRNPVWQEKPTVGYLNAFDVLVYTGAAESSPLLSSLIQKKDRRDLAHAGFLTLDRLVQRQTLEMLTRLESDSALQKSRPEMTAQQFARADLRDLQQQAVVKAWLLDEARTPAELRNFAATYPNNNKMISNNLLTSEENVSGAYLAEHDREVLGIIRSWRTEPEFKPLSEYLEIMDRRVSEFVKGADKPTGGTDSE